MFTSSEEKPVPDAAVYTVNEAVAKMRVSRATLYRMFEGGVIAKRKAQGRTLVPKASVQAWLDGEAA